MSVVFGAGLILVSSLLSTTTILNFDGSWQPSTISTNKQPSASCAAVISRRRGDVEGSVVNDNDGLALGAKVLHNCPSSAHSEYEGLILGLKYLVNEDHQHPATNEHIASSLQQQNSNDTLIVRGDCKTVVTQLTGAAIPRILMDQYNEANALLEILCGRFGCIRYELVDRSENRLSDALAREVLKIVQSFTYSIIYQMCQALIDEYEEESDDTEFSAGLDLVMSHPLLLPMQRYALLRLISDNFMLSFDECDSSAALTKLKDKRLIKVGAAMRQLSQSINILSKAGRGGMFALGLRCEILAKQRLGFEQEALALEHKYRYKLKVAYFDWNATDHTPSAVDFTVANDEHSNLSRQSNVRIEFSADDSSNEKYSSAFEVWQSYARNILSLHYCNESLVGISTLEQVPILWKFIPISYV
mmetsp:Transcript_12644/g.18997  ORF Transcript_12644/g.18997 Transcript_12644/m.18997 type:complete len:417 (+) Transcript_12644:55-1305(+)